MAEEETTIIRKIIFGPADPDYSTVDEVIRLLRDLTPTDKIHLVLGFIDIDGFRFSETVELRKLIIRKNSNIHHLEVIDCFEFFVQFVLANNGETKHFVYAETTEIPIQLDQSTRLSTVIRSNNNNNGTIESFFFSGWCDSGEVFQPVWDALLTTGVEDIKLFLVFSKHDGSNLNFSNISTNTSLKTLQITFTLYATNLFDSIKSNKTLEKLIVKGLKGDTNLDKRGKRAFVKMLLENITLIHVELKDGNFNQILREQINTHTQLNRMWKRLIIVKHEERIAASAVVTINTTTNNVVTTIVGNATVERREEQENNVTEVEKNKKIAEEKKMIKKKKEMNLWLKTFEKKPAMRNELIYLFLTENADMYNTIINVTPSKVVGERKGKRQK